MVGNHTGMWEPSIYFFRNPCPSPEKASGCKNNETIRRSVQSCRQWPGPARRRASSVHWCVSHRGPSGEACSEKQGEERRPPSRLTHISGAEAQGAVALRGQEWMYPPSPEPWWVGLSPTSHFRFLQGRLAYPPVQGIPSRHLGSDTSTVRSDGGGPAVETNTAQAAAATPPPRPPLS